MITALHLNASQEVHNLTIPFLLRNETVTTQLLLFIRLSLRRRPTAAPSRRGAYTALASIHRCVIRVKQQLWARRLRVRFRRPDGGISPVRRSPSKPRIARTYRDLGGDREDWSRVFSAQFVAFRSTTYTRLDHQS